eukprot:gene33898-41812_t
MNAGLYGNSEFQSNPLQIHFNSDMPCVSTDGSASCSIDVDVVLQNNAPLDVSDRTPEPYFSACRFDDYSVHQYQCPDNFVFNASCNGTAQILSSRCPYIQPHSVCNSLVGSNSIYSGCVAVAYTSTNTTCRCPIKGPALDTARRLIISTDDDGNSSSALSSGSANFVSMLSFLSKDFTTTILSADSLSASSVKSSWKVLATLGSLGISMLLFGLFAHKADGRMKKIKPTDKQLEAIAKADTLTKYKKVTFRGSQLINGVKTRLSTTEIQKFLRKRTSQADTELNQYSRAVSVVQDARKESEHASQPVALEPLAFKRRTGAMGRTMTAVSSDSSASGGKKRRFSIAALLQFDVARSLSTTLQDDLSALLRGLCEYREELVNEKQKFEFNSLWGLDTNGYFVTDNSNSSAWQPRYWLQKASGDSKVQTAITNDLKDVRRRLELEMETFGDKKMSSLAKTSPSRQKHEGDVGYVKPSFSPVKQGHVHTTRRESVQRGNALLGQLHQFHPSDQQQHQQTSHVVERFTFAEDEDEECDSESEVGSHSLTSMRNTNNREKVIEEEKFSLDDTDVHFHFPLETYTREEVVVDDHGISSSSSEAGDDSEDDDEEGIDAGEGAATRGVKKNDIAQWVHDRYVLKASALTGGGDVGGSEKRSSDIKVNIYDSGDMNNDVKVDDCRQPLPTVERSLESDQGSVLSVLYLPDKTEQASTAMAGDRVRLQSDRDREAVVEVDLSSSSEEEASDGGMY